MTKPLSAVLGQDVSGTVEISRAPRYAAGDDVFGVVARGGYAELATASDAAIAKKPGSVSHEQAAAIPVADTVGGNTTEALVAMVRREASS